MSKVMEFALDKPRWSRLLATLKYALYIPLHPFDGFWDLTHEKRGSLAAANIIVVAASAVEVLRYTVTNFQFMWVHMEYFNALIVILSMVMPLLLWTVANWSLTTLLDGKGRLTEIYMATAYALTPHVIVSAVLIVASHVLTIDEGAFYYFFSTTATIWSAFLVLCGMMMIHNYSFSKSVFSGLLTIVGIGVMVFLFIMFFSIISDAVSYFVSLYKEIAFRLT